MKELSLVHPIDVKRAKLTVLREGNGQTWTRLPDGGYVVFAEGNPDEEFVIPAAGVRYERRPRSNPSGGAKRP